MSSVFGSAPKPPKTYMPEPTAPTLFKSVIPEIDFARAADYLAELKRQRSEVSQLTDSQMASAAGRKLQAATSYAASLPAYASQAGQSGINFAQSQLDEAKAKAAAPRMLDTTYRPSWAISTPAEAAAEDIRNQTVLRAAAEQKEKWAEEDKPETPAERTPIGLTRGKDPNVFNRQDLKAARKGGWSQQEISDWVSSGEGKEAKIGSGIASQFGIGADSDRYVKGGKIKKAVQLAQTVKAAGVDDVLTGKTPNQPGVGPLAPTA